MNGRLQVDMLNWFRRTENLTSYKLDYVGSHFIGDDVKSLIHRFTDDKEVTRISTNNMTGLHEESYIHFEEINHSSDYYKDGKKFKVINVCKDEGWFEILGTETPYAKKVKWGLAKDDVTPKDIFRMTNEGSASRAVIAKYCIQDCNLVHYLFNKVDVVTDLVEMSKLCSVPMSFLIFRGQGIKLTSYVAKKCREKGVLMPVIDKGSKNDGYEGAIVLPPKCGLYLDEAVCVGDFASLYPSSMLSENLCPSSKVWTKIYDLAGNLILETGEKAQDGKYIYDNLPEIEYVDVRFDTYRYIRKTPKGKAEKIKSGYKLCRFAQPVLKDGHEEKAIMPSILQELLKARKDTRKLIPQTPDEFMKNVLDKRQIAYKLTANSLYGQLGAKTSTFYEPDIAASTTATGRLLLTFAKRVVEECYIDTDIETKYGFVNTKAEYIYGDSVANYTPVYVKVNSVMDILTIEQLAVKYGNDNWIKSTEPGKQDKEFCELSGVETWTEKGWTTLFRVIRHELASHKKMIRVLTFTGCVDVTDDHSLVKSDRTEISPKEVVIGTELLHHPLLEQLESNIYDNTELFASHFDNMIEASIYVNYLNSKNINFRINSGDDLSIIVVPDPLGYRNIIAIKKLYEIQYTGYVYDLTTENHHFAAGVGNIIVHNTDSVFFKFNLTNKETGEKILGDKALELSIEIAQEACHQVSKVLKQPHDFEYEKTFMPFCLLSKKRYVSIKYDFDWTKGKRNEMGIVLKRRDNAPIVKDIYGGVIDILMKEKNIQKAIDYVHKCLQDLVNGNVSIDKLIITKSLRSFYKNPQGVAHKVLADRISQREPGNKPTSGDRIPFVYVVTKSPAKGKKVLQGDRIETPSFIKENNLQIDYSFYITNQIMKPLLQLFGLVLKDIWLSQKPPRRAKVTKLKETIDKIKLEIEDEKKCDKKISKIKDKEVEELIFSKYLRDTNNAKNCNQSVTNFFPITK
jgi:DNA polymerase elongation subunit (family B)